MKPITILAFALGSCLPAFAQEAPDFSGGELTVGGLQRSWDSDESQQATTLGGAVNRAADSSKFLEYRDLQQGAVVPGFRFQGKKGEWRWDLSGRDVSQQDQNYFLLVDKGVSRLSGEYVGIPHNFGFGGRSILNAVRPNEWRMSDSLQQAFEAAIVAVPPTAAAGGQIDYNCEPRPGFNPLPTCFSLLALVEPTLAAQPANVDLKLHRGRSRVAYSLTPGGGDLDVGLSYMHEKRTGTRAANGTAFGFGNVVETPEPVRYVTQDFAVNASLRGNWGVARAGVRFNDFADRYDDFLFDNPFRATPGSDPNAYQAPATTTRNGAVFGLMALPPDNRAVTESAGATLKFGARTRLTADVAFGQWRQDEDELLPWTTNPAVIAPSGRPGPDEPLPATTLGGKIDTMALNGFVTTRVGPLNLSARYRYYDHDNKTPRYRLQEGYVRYDAVWEEIPRITVPYGYSSNMLDLFANYGAGAFGLEAGWRRNAVDRQFRDTRETSEHVFRAAGDYRGGWFTARAVAEIGSRDFDAYDGVRAEEESFLHEPGEPAPPANQTVLRRYDQQRRDLTRLGGQLELAPGSGKLGLFASYFHTKFEYDQDPVVCEDVELFPGQEQFCPGGSQAPLGLIDDQYDSVNVEANYNPTDRVSLYAFYGWEDGDILQNGRQSAGTLNFNPADVWTVNITTRGNTFGAGADYTIVPEKWSAGLFARYQDIEGFNGISLQPGFSTAIYGTNPALQECATAGATPCDIPAFDDTKLTYVYASLRYRFATQWSAAVGVGFEDYEIDDSQTENQINYMPGSFFLQANNRDYTGWVSYVNLTYSFQ